MLNFIIKTLQKGLTLIAQGTDHVVVTLGDVPSRWAHELLLECEKTDSGVSVTARTRYEHPEGGFGEEVVADFFDEGFTFVEASEQVVVQVEDLPLLLEEAKARAAKARKPEVYFQDRLFS